MIDDAVRGAPGSTRMPYEDRGDLGARIGALMDAFQVAR
jgi:hypothetical protein